MRFSILLLIILGIASFNNSLLGQRKEIKGIIRDKETGAILPFATIGFRTVNVGTVSESDGTFNLKFDENLLGDTLTISYIGYKNNYVRVTGKDSLTIELLPDLYEIGEAVVYSLSPEEYMREVIRRISDNYMNIPFEILSHYKEEIREVDRPVKVSEAGILSYQYPFDTDSSSLNQLLLYNELDVADINFRRERFLKNQKKKQRKAERKNEEYELEKFDGSILGYVGPSEVLDYDYIKLREDFLDSILLENYIFEFGEESTYDGELVTVITFDTKDNIPFHNLSGKLYIDRSSKAIIKVETKQILDIPWIVRFLLPSDLKPLRKLNVTRVAKYKSFKGRWFPESMQSSIGLDLVYKRMFAKNDLLQITVFSYLNVKEIQTNGIMPILKEKNFDREKDVEEQIFPIEGISWESIE